MEKINKDACKKECTNCTSEPREFNGKFKDMHMYDLKWCSCKLCKVAGKYDWCQDEMRRNDVEEGCPYGSTTLPC